MSITFNEICINEEMLPIYIYMCVCVCVCVCVYKKDLVLNNLQWLICYKTKPNPTKPNNNNLGLSFFYYYFIGLNFKS